MKNKIFDKEFKYNNSKYSKPGITLSLAILMVLTLFIVGCGKSNGSNKGTEVVNLTTNYIAEPLALDSIPFFSWQLSSAEEEKRQLAYQLTIARSETELDKGKNLIWDTGKQESDESVAIEYAGAALEPETRYYWKVTVWDEKDKKISAVSFFDTGVTDGNWEGAQWISVPSRTTVKNAQVSGESAQTSDENAQTSGENAQSSDGNAQNSDENTQSLDVNAKNVGVHTRFNSEGCIETPTSYSIEFDLEAYNSELGLVWGNETNRYGEYIVCGLDCNSEDVKVIMASHRQEEVLWKEERSLNDLGVIFDENQNSHAFKIDVNGNNINVYVEGQPALAHTLDTQVMAGHLGTYEDRGNRIGYIDNILVKSGEGEILLSEDFESADNIFNPFYTKIDDGRLRITSGLLLMPGGEDPAPMLRKEFTVGRELKDIENARLYISSLGSFEAAINGEKVGEDYFAPGTSYYDKTVYYQTYDVKELLEKENAIAVTLGHYRYDRAKSTWGDELAMLCKLELTYKDGSQEIIKSDDSWKGYNDGPVRQDDIFWGEYYDANHSVEEWDKPGFDDSMWLNVNNLQMDVALSNSTTDPGNIGEAETATKEGAVAPASTRIRLVALEKPAVRCIEELKPVSITEPKENVWVYDFGKNISGICRTSINAPAGDVVTLRYAEYLNEEGMTNTDDVTGSVWTVNLYTAKNTDYYVSDGKLAVFEPSLTCRGFRYMQISGLTNAPTEEEISALVLSSDNERTGSFECSNADLNRLYEAIYATQISNFVDIPTDCPQRDERLAWTGDAQVFAPTASYNSNTYQFYTSFLQAMRDGQNEDGSLQDMTFIDFESAGNNGWGDAGITIPWTLYSQFGTQTVIEDNLDMMCRYMDYLIATSDNYIRNHEGSYGDHLAPSKTDNAMSDTAQCAYDALLLSKMCAAVGQEELATKYAGEYENYRSAWQQNYINEDGSINNWYQDEYILGLAFGLYPEGLDVSGAEKLNISVEAGDFHAMTGYVTTPFLLPILSQYGYQNSAYKLLKQNTSPSWLGMLTHNRTNISEGWSYLDENEDGTYSIDGSMNHYALGSVGSWFYEGILGIKKNRNGIGNTSDFDDTIINMADKKITEYIGWKHFVLEPIVDPEMEFAKGSYNSVYGLIESSWEHDGDIVRYSFTIPANTTATVILPDGERELGSGKYVFEVE